MNRDWDPGGYGGQFWSSTLRCRKEDCGMSMRVIANVRIAQYAVYR